ncbi:putative polypeptide N-acetylgalactosaminyltransferase 10 [Symsagittifera roscoffensis]|uniref:putative polypeptide N-acetylgalactosaminyltransferase 10 n=1 Tax=Symsagittifera roscoffensis TaxID=84072 RepID=UPI00307BD4C4
MTYKKIPIPEIEAAKRKSQSDVFFTPVLFGGVFAIHADWWKKLKGFDPFLDIWSGEQFEMSFKTWMCGGEVIETPCSRVARVHRGSMNVPYSPRAAIERSMSNMPRVANVWMDEYKEFFFYRKPDRRFARLMTGIEQRFEIRQKLQCHSFDWFMKNINFNQPTYYPAVEPRSHAHGRARSQEHMMKCINRYDKKLMLSKCEGAPSISLTWRKEFIFDKDSQACLDVGSISKHDRKPIPTC